MEDLIQDLRLVLRVMRRSKGFAAATLLTLALGIGANTAVFSVVYGVLLRPLPYPESDRLVRLSEVHPGATAALGWGRLSNLTFHAWSESARTIDSMAAYSYLSGFRFPARDSGEPIMARAREYGVTLGYGEALGLRLQEGRFLTEQDAGAGTQAMLVNQEFVRQYLPGGPVAGRRFGGFGSEGRTTDIVGVLGNVLKDRLDAPPQPEIYLVHRFSEVFARELHLAVRTAGNPLALAPVVRGFVNEIDRNAAIDRMTPLARSMAASVSQPRFAAAVVATFAALTLALAAVGLYGVLSYGVLQRRRELGVRAALGATRRDLLRLVVGQGLVLAGAGIALGLAGAAALARLMANVLFGVTPHDAVVFATAPLLLLVIAFAACLLPGGAAASADPAEALRCE